MTRVQGLRDMLHFARVAQSGLKGKQLADFLTDANLSHATIWRVSVVGEAARRAFPVGSDPVTGIPHTRLISLRNLLIHRYDMVSLHEVYRTVTFNFPTLIKALSAELGEPVA